ncbi:MAG TPA: DUF3152 domain-containing protein [Patescibacteria group bacterium]|nr:DUF3152 domain-containing protein [Patescibacteria group bacterium]
MIRKHYLTILFAIVAVVIVGLGLNTNSFNRQAKFIPKEKTATGSSSQIPANKYAEPLIESEISFQEYVPPPLSRTYSYCIKLKNVDESYRKDFSAKVAETYADHRGWGLDGRIKFLPVLEGCSFVVWLSSSADLPSFNSVCSSFYSCAVGSNVIINFDRWNGGSPSWNGVLSDYQALVINHETGHWLGFGHASCGGSGQPAPVMQQQSISLQGCTENPWPLLWERGLLAKRYGVVLKN